MRLTSARLIGALVLGIGCALLSTAHAQQDVKRQIGITTTDDKLLVTFSYKDVFTAPIKKKLKSGLPTRVVVRAFLEHRGKPVALWARSTSIVYDLWEEVFIVTDEDNRGRRKARAKSATEAINLAGILWRGAIADTSSLPSGHYHLHVTIEVNPVSKKMVENIQRWLAKPPAGKSGVETQSNFFGSFVGIFVDRRIGQADHTLNIVSQPFKLGTP